jgi:hypothetical protein
LQPDPEWMNRCDVDTSGSITVFDSLRIAQESVGIAVVPCSSSPIRIEFEFLITELVSPPGGGDPLCAGVCDVDRDFDGDAVVSSTTETSIFRNDSVASRPDFGGEVITLGGDSWWTYRYLDFDGDLDADMVAVSHPDYELSEVRFYANQFQELGGAGSPLSFQQVFGVLPPLETSGARDLDMTDVDGDGDLDLFVGRGPDALTPLSDLLYLGNGAGGYSPAPVASYPQDARVTVNVDFVDVDLDGDPDLLMGFEDGRPVDVYLNDGAGSFSASAGAPLPWFPPMPQRATVDVAVGDVDRDGQPDALVTAIGYGAELWRNAGTQYQLVAWFPGLVVSPSPVRARQGSVMLDLNGDDLPELLVPSSTFNLLLNLDGQSFYPETQALSIQPATSHVGDIDLDGRIDVIFLDPAGNVPALTRLVR